MANPLTFRVSAALKSIVGRDLITNDFIAVFELVKNSFDAHATRVRVTFDKDKITIRDNGKGMTYEDIVGKWLFLAYSAKHQGVEDDDLEKKDDLKDYRDKIHQKRFYAGAKGIGRFSCDRLGRSLTLITKSAAKGANIEQLQVEWEDFENDPKEEFINIKVKHETLSGTNYKNFNHGTILEITNLPEDANWNREKLIELKQSLEKLIDPFDSLKDDDKAKFTIEIKCENEEEQDKKVRSRRDKVNGPVSNEIFETLHLKTTHIQTDIAEDGRLITTTLVDRGTPIYEFKEKNKSVPKLTGISMQLFFLNRAAKINFTKQMGMHAVEFGSVFLYKNGFRVYPFGEEGKDLLGIDRRKAQGYSRYLGTRDLIGRIAIVDEDGNFKETSSRDGGLVETPLYNKLVEYFHITLRRLESYVVGVQWAKSIKDLRDKDKNSQDISVLDNNRAKSMILEMILKLTDSEEYESVRYNKDFLNIVNSKVEEFEPKAITNLSRLALKTNDDEFHKEIQRAEKEILALIKEKEEAERLASLEEEARRKAEIALAREKDKNTFLLATSRGVSKDAQGLIHNIKLASKNIKSSTAILMKRVRDEHINKKEFLKRLSDIQFSNEKSLKISELITRSNFKEQATTQEVDLFRYVEQYLDVYRSIYKRTVEDYSINFDFESDGNEYWTHVSVLELSIILDNLISNSIKADARNIQVDMNSPDPSACIIVFSDNGNGLSREYIDDPEQIFELGVTNTVGGSGIGLFTVREALKKMRGTVEFIGNGLNLKGAAFKLTFNKKVS